MIRNCNGCGVSLQDTHEEKAGYVKVIKDANVLYCQRCFRLKHYSELPKILATKEDYERVVDDVLSKKGLVVMLVDLFDFQGSFIPKIVDKLRPRNVLLVANKVDLLPKSTNVSKVVDWLSYMCNKVFFRVDAIHVVSSSKGYYLDELMQTIDFLRKEQDVYFVGCANVGKSTLINALIKKYTTKVIDLISTSVIPGTTLDAIRVPFFIDNKALVDTPGLINENSLLDKLLPASFTKVLPSKEIKPITYQLIKENSIFISGMAVTSLIKGQNISLTCYFSDKLIIHRCKNERVNDLFNNHLGEMLSPPTKEELENIEYTEKTFEIKEERKMDLVFSGLGFISVNKPCTLKVKYIKGMDVFLRRSII